MGIDQQSQHEEHHNLEQPCHAIEKSSYFLLLEQAAVADDHTGNINRQIPIAFQQIDRTINDENETKHHDGIKLGILQAHTVDEPYGQTSQQIPPGYADYKLQQKRPQDFPT